MQRTAVLVAGLCLLTIAHSGRLNGETPDREHAVRIHASMSDRLSKPPIHQPGMPLDTVLGRFTFDSANRCVTEDWTGVDLTGQDGTWFHVDTYWPLQEHQSMWCGARPDPLGPLGEYVSLPGYGDLWDQSLESTRFSVQGNVTFSFHARYDTEPDGDRVYVEYAVETDNWVNLFTFSGTGDSVCVANIAALTHAGAIAFRFRFVSDEAHSDEDGLWDSEGAFMVDSIVISDETGIVDAQNFEVESVGDTQSFDADWTASAGEGFGDFAHLFSGLFVLQEDLCYSNPTCVWGFFKGSTSPYSCGGHPAQIAVPFANYRGQYIVNEIWSPWIDYPPDPNFFFRRSVAVLEFKVYDDLPLDNLVFYTWKIRSKVGGEIAPWRDRNLLYYGGQKSWITFQEEVSDLLEVGVDSFQVALGIIDKYDPWYGIYGSGVCHSHSPMYDTVSVFVPYRDKGPVWHVEDKDLFQDGFPDDGSTTGTVRVDIGQSISSVHDPSIQPGDSTVVECSEPQYGLALEGTYGKAAVYMHVRSTGGQVGDVVSDDLARWPVVAIDGPWTKVLMDSVYNTRGTVLTHRYCADLNDSLFAPPDRIDFYFSALGGQGNTTYYSQFTGRTRDESEVRSWPMEMQCLPTGNSDILYVDDFNERGAQPYFDVAFEQMDLTPDRYDVRGPSSLLGNGLGSRATGSQIVDVYRKILWNSGDLPVGTIGDGSGQPEKSPDVQLLYDFLDLTSAFDPGLYISGDDIAEELQGKPSAAYASFIADYIDFSLLAGDHCDAGHGISPRVIANTPGTIFQHTGDPDSLIAFGGCPIKNDFDVLAPGASAAVEMYYDGSPASGAVISQSTSNAYGKTARVVLSGFSYHLIRSDAVEFPMDYVDHLIDIIRWFGNAVEDPTGAVNVPLRNSLSLNYPNPFNATTRIEFSIKEKSHVSLNIYDVSGRLVRTLEDRVLASKTYALDWDGRNNGGEAVASGVYFCRLKTEHFSKTVKMVLLK